MTTRPRLRLVVLLAGLLCAFGAAAQAPLPLEERLARLPRWGTIVYVTAHPDDESAAIITYLARGLHCRVVILAMTRGEGGQNQDGPELSDEMAWVRTRELQAAATGYGAEVRFLGAGDFGYSKSVEETFRVWDEDKVVGELVRQIRLLRPLAVISHWSDQAPAGAHHQAAGILTRRGVPLAGDPKAYPEQLAHGLQPWQPRYFLLRSYNPEEGKTLPVPVDQPSPVAGKSYEELGWEAFRSHRSQGMHQIDLSQVRFLRRYFLRVEGVLSAGVPAPASVAELAPDLAALPELFPSVEISSSARERLAQGVELAGRAPQLLAEQKRSEAARALVEGAGLLNDVTREFPPEASDQETSSARAWMEAKQDEFLEAAAELAGARLNALADRAVLTPGETVHVSLGLELGDPAVATAAGFEAAGLQVVAPENWTVEPAAGGAASSASGEFFVRVPPRADPAQTPYPVLRARALLKTGRMTVVLEAPVRGLGPARPESAAVNIQPVSLAPALTVEIGPPLRLLRASAGEATHEVWVRVENHSAQPGKISVWLEVPNGWYTPLPQAIELAPGGSATARFTLTIPAGVTPGSYELQAVAGRGGETFRRARRPQPEAGPEPPFVFEPARARVEVLGVSVPAALRVGYVGFNNDPVAALVAQLGVGVDMLDERALAAAKLDAYDAIVIADRAYDYRADLKEQNARLLDYAKAGGTLLVEHQGRDWDPAKLAPYPGLKPPGSNLRVTVESAPVKMLAPDHPLLTFPNRISDDDWKGWVQERGLYFWESWAPEYTPLVEMADPGEKPLGGALLAARYGQGTYIYCGLALFRQVRAGVPGGVRLYVNLLSQRRATAASAEQK